MDLQSKIKQVEQGDKNMKMLVKKLGKEGYKIDSKINKSLEEYFFIQTGDNSSLMFFFDSYYDYYKLLVNDNHNFKHIECKTPEELYDMIKKYV